MMINALNSGASVFMADFEDALSPTWQNVVEGQVNLCDAVRRTIELETGQDLPLNEKTACWWCARAAGTWTNVHCSSTASRLASLFDFGL